MFDKFFVLLEICQLCQHLKATRINNQDTKTWTVLQFLEFIVKLDFWESLLNLFLYLKSYLLFICYFIWEKHFKIKINEKYCLVNHEEREMDIS